MRCGWIRPSSTSRSSVSRPTSRRTGSKQDSSTASGVSSMIRLTPVTDSKARMLRPSRPMIRPFISSPGRCSTETTDSLVCSLATRWMASVTILRARLSPSLRASASISRTISAASRLAWFSMPGDQLGLGLVGGQPGDPLQDLPALGVELLELGPLPVQARCDARPATSARWSALRASSSHPLLALGQADLTALQVGAQQPDLFLDRLDLGLDLAAGHRSAWAADASARATIAAASLSAWARTCSACRGGLRRRPRGAAAAGGQRPGCGGLPAMSAGAALSARLASAAVGLALAVGQRAGSRAAVAGGVWCPAAGRHCGARTSHERDAARPAQRRTQRSPAVSAIPLFKSHPFPLTGPRWSRA